MYRAEEIKTGLFGMWGWRQHYDDTEFQIDAALTASETGQYYQEVHPLLTLTNVRAIAPQFENDTQFNTWLKQKTESSILKAIRTLWDEKAGEESAKNILESKTLFDGTGRLKDLIVNGDNVVGFELVINRSKGVTTRIDKIGLQFKGIGDIKLYLMHSSRPDVLKELTFTRTRDGGMEWFVPTSPLYLPYESSEIDSGGSWYLVYSQENLSSGVQAVNKEKDWSKLPCASCSRSEYVNYNIWSKYLEVHPFKVKGEIENGLWDVEDMIHTYEYNYGLNLQLTIECDITDVIIQQKLAFQNIIGLQVAKDMLREFAYNPNFNISRTEQNFSRQEILYELDGDSQSYKKSGIKFEFDKAMKAIKLDTTSMSRVCFPCAKKGVRYRTM